MKSKSQIHEKSINGIFKYNRLVVTIKILKETWEYKK